MKNIEIKNHVEYMKEHISRAAKLAASFNAPFCVIGNEETQVVKPFDGLVLDKDNKKVKLLFYVASRPNWKLINYLVN